MRLPHNYMNIELLYGMVDNGWLGQWSVDEVSDELVIHNANGNTINEYIKDKPLLYHEAKRLATCLAIHMMTLQKFGKGVLFFNDNNITVIDENWFMLTTTETVLPLVDDNDVMLSRIIHFDGFVPPEIKHINALPFKTNISCAYFSAALLIVNALKLKDIEDIKDSSMYFFLKRCLNEDPNKRYFIIF